MENNKETGTVLLHEHVFNLYPSEEKIKNEAFTLELLEELVSYNVRYIVDLTPYADVSRYTEIIDSSPIPIKCCIGFSYGRHVSEKDKRKSVDTLYEEMEHAFLYGIGKRKLRPSIIKLSTNTKELKDYEWRFASAAICLSNKYSLPVAYHCPFNTYSNYCNLLDLGINPERLMICHYENQYSRMAKNAYLKQAVEIAAMGSYVQFNDFGTKAASQKSKDTVDLFKNLLDHGHKEKILLSSDCNWTWKKGVPQLKNGNMKLGYRYLFEYTLPLLRKNGIEDSVLNLILNSNPVCFMTGESENAGHLEKSR